LALGEILLALALPETGKDPQWEALANFANELIILPDWAAGLRAEVAIASQDWQVAKTEAEKALQGKERQGFYLLSLGRSLMGMNQAKEAIAPLERAKALVLPEVDPDLHIRILQALHRAYTAVGNYRDAFTVKCDRESVETSYGFRAFIGAGRLQPQRRVGAIGEDAMEEIAASGRQADIEALVDRVKRSDCRLTVVHGPSGVGKSSLLQSGLVPALRKVIHQSRSVQPVVIEHYEDWQGELASKLGIAPLAPQFWGEQDNLESSKSPSIGGFRGLDGLTDTLISQLHDRDRQNLITVLIFDQFEEFFFKHTDVPDRRKLYDFLRECLAVPYVWVILSLREDYIHYLLECDRLANIELINNDILNKNVRYYLGNFSKERAKAVIKELTERSPYRLEEALVDRLVADLAAEFGEVRPIELQVVGAQMLHGEVKITALAAYEGLGNNPKRALVEWWLMQVVRDCGQENEELAQRVLYALTEEPEKRPAKTRTELQRDVLLDTPELPEEQRDFAVQGDLDFVLTVPIGSGLAFEIPASPETCYQLIHDYLVLPIRQQFGGNLERQLEEERKKRKDAEENLRNRNRLLLQGSILGVIVIAFGIIISIFAVQSGRIATANKRTIDTFLLSLKWKQLMNANLFSLDAQVETIEKTKEINTYLDDLAVDSHVELISALHQASILRKEKSRFVGHQDSVISVAFSADGKRVLTGSEDKTAKLWNLDGDLLQTFNEKSIVNSVAFAPDGKSVLTGNSDGSVKLWSLDGTVLNTIYQGKEQINSVAFAPNGNSVLIGSTDKVATLRSLNGNLLQSFKGHLATVNSVAFSSDGKSVLTGSEDKTAKLWSMDGSLQKTFQRPYNESSPSSVAFTPNNQDVMIVYIPIWRDGSISVDLWSQDGKLLIFGEEDSTTFPDRKVNSIAFSPDGKNILIARQNKTAILRSMDISQLQTATYDSDNVEVTLSPDRKKLFTRQGRWYQRNNQAKLWDLNGKLVRTYKDWDSIDSVTFSPDGNKLLTIESTGFRDKKESKLWDLNGKLIRTYKDWDRVNRVTFSPDGNKILTIERDQFGENIQVKLWDLEGNLQRNYEGWGAVNSAIFSPDGKKVLTLEKDKFTEDNISAKLWDINGQLIQNYKDWEGVNKVVFSSDSNKLMTIMNNKSNTNEKKTENIPAKLWSLDGKLLKIYEDGGKVSSIDFAPNNDGLLTGSEDGMVKLWSLDGKLQQSFQADQSSIKMVAFTPDGKGIITQSATSTVKLWSLDGKLLNVLVGKDVVSRIAFSKDGKSVLTGSADGTANVRSLNGELQQTFLAHLSGISSVAISPDSKTLLTGSWDKTAKLWSLDGQLLQTFKGHQERIFVVAFAPDGKSVLTASADKSAKLWNLDGKLLHTFLHEDKVTSISFALDGKSVLTGSADKTVKLWNVQNGQLQKTFTGHQDTIVSVAFAPDGKSILTGSADKAVKLWEINGREKQNYQSGYPFIVLFSPDGNTVLVSDSDRRLGKVTSWSLDGRLLQILQDHETTVLGMAFAPDGKTLLTGSADKVVKLWNFDLKNSLSLLCEHLRDFASASNKPNIPDKELRERAKKACENIPPPSQ